MKKKVLLCCVIAMLTQVSNINAQSYDVGTLPGESNVSPSGAFTFTIPIALPPGRAGMEPALALTYNSQGGNGLLGIGWSLGGLSSITRIGKTIYHDGVVDGVDFDLNDKYMLDGSRLIAVNEEQTEFRTEVETHSKVIAHGTAGNGPQRFEVFTRDGLIMEYGNSPKSGIEASGRSDILTWHLNRIKDRRGNYIEYTYEEELGLGRIIMISYSGNEISGNNPTYNVVFEYSDDNNFRVDKNKYFVSGSKIEQKRILEKVEIKNKAGNILHTYDFKYDQSGIYTHMVEVELSDKNDKKLVPTIFEWGINSPTVFDFDGVNEISIDGYDNVEYTFGDFNGDGKTDIVCTFYQNGNIDHFSVFYSNDDGTTFTEVEDYILNLNKNTHWYFITGDYNGDGLEDLASFTSNVYKIYISNGSGFTKKVVQTYNHGDKHYFKNVDLNGNGIDELILVHYNYSYDSLIGYVEGNPVYVEKFKTYINVIEHDFYSIPESVVVNELLTGNGDNGYEYVHFENDLLELFPGDYSGNGKTDILINRDNNESYIMVYQESSKKIVPLNTQPLNFPTKSHKQIFPGDYNGDGVMDLLTGLTYNQTTDWELHYFNGSDNWINGICPVTIPIGSTNEDCIFEFTNFKTLTSDFNGDGKTDILQFYEEYCDPKHGGEQTFIQSHYVVHYSNGLSFNSDLNTSSSSNVLLERPYAYNDFNGDGKHDCFLDDKTENGYNQIIFFSKNRQDQIINKITNGYGLSTEIEYAPLTNNTIYTKRTNAVFPLADIQPSTLAVTITRTDNDFGDYFSMSYRYEGAILHKQGKGYLGFQQLQVNNNQNNIYTISKYKVHQANDLHFYPYMESSETWWTSKLYVFKIGELYNEFDVIENGFNNKIFSPVYTMSLQHNWDIDDENSFIRTVKTIQDIGDMDIYANSTKNSFLLDPKYLTKDHPDSGFDFKTVVESDYADDIELSNWLISRPGEITVTNTSTGKPSDKSKVEYKYYTWNEAGNNGVVSWPMVKSVTTTPNGDDLFKNKVLYDYDVFGHVEKKTLSAPYANPAVDDRIINYEYKADAGYESSFLTKTKRTVNNVPYISQFDYDLETGYMATSKNPAQLSTNYSYDGFGKVTNLSYPDGTSGAATYVLSGQSPWWNMLAPSKAVFCIMTQESGSGSIYMFYDKLQRELRQVTIGMEGDVYIFVDMSYHEDNGRLKTMSDPYFSTSTPQNYTSYKYDDLGRVTTVTTPTNSYDKKHMGRMSTVTDKATGVRIIREVNALGNVQTVTDPTGIITYNYFSSGNVENIDALGAVSTMLYDAAGNQIQLDEPNAGRTVYQYNAFGELIEQTDARLNKYRFDYDVFGRLTTKTLVNNGETTTYQYKDDISLPVGDGFGMLELVIGPNNITYDFHYDSFNRLGIRTETIEGVPYTTSFTYNTDGKPETFTYPSDFSVSYHYTNTGHLKTVTDNKNELVIWEALAKNCYNQLTDYVLGNNLATHKQIDDFGYVESIATGLVQYLEYDFNIVTGNLNWRKDHLIDKTESFTYDNTLQTRLSSWTIGTSSFNIDYGMNGNIAQKSDVTAMTEPPGQYLYGQNAGCHAVTGIENPTSIYSGSIDPQDVTYTAFNKVESITKRVTEQGHGGPIETKYTENFIYGPDNLRKQLRYSQDGVLQDRKYYIGGNYEIEVNKNGYTRKLHYIYGGDGLFAIYEMNEQATNTEFMYYVHKDYLGNYETITDEKGQVVEKLAFDPWGRRRNPTDWTFNNVPTQYLFDRGFTGHEHHDEFELINMNGRVYDPWLGRFLSPDPIIQSPGNSQSYNRYSYAYNNPLKYTDPSGYYSPEKEGVDISGREGRNYGASFLSNQSSLYNPYRPGFMGYTAHNINASYGRSYGTIRYHKGLNSYFNTWTGDKVTYSQTHNNVILPNSVTLTGVAAQSMFLNLVGGMTIYTVEAYGRTTLVSAFGRLGSADIASNGGISFTNPTASAYAGEANVVASSEGGNPVSAGFWVTSFNIAMINNMFNGVSRNFKALQAKSKSLKLGLDYSDELLKTGKIIKGMRIGAGILGGFGIGYDAYNTFGANVTMSKGQFWTNVGFTAVGFFGIPGAAVAGFYFGVDAFVPGGWDTVHRQQYNRYMNQVEGGVMRAPWIFGK